MHALPRAQVEHVQQLCLAKRVKIKLPAHIDVCKYAYGQTQHQRDLCHLSPDVVATRSPSPRSCMEEVPRAI
eukprot:9467299-Pyramimonas_sp.AAC.1